MAFVVWFVIEEAVADDAFAGEAFDFCDFDDLVLAGWFAVMAEVVVVWGEVEVFDVHGGLVVGVSR